MSNSRKSLYENTFSDYIEICLNKYFPEIPLPEKKVQKSDNVVKKKARTLIECFFKRSGKILI